jgi:hypothetical protein
MHLTPMIRGAAFACLSDRIAQGFKLSDAANWRGHDIRSAGLP